MEGNCGVLLAEDSHPLLRHPSRNEIDFVEHKNKMFMRLLLLHVSFNGRAPSSNWITGVENIDNNVTAVDNLNN